MANSSRQRLKPKQRRNHWARCGGGCSKPLG
jgi:hypothetical protein